MKAGQWNSSAELIRTSTYLIFPHHQLSKMHTRNAWEGGGIDPDLFLTIQILILRAGLYCVSDVPPLDVILCPRY